MSSSKPLTTPIEPASNETSPLLGGEGARVSTTTTTNGEALSTESRDNNIANDENDEDKPLPKTQIFLLCYARLVEPVAFFSIFPFINQMIFDIGVDQARVGFYSGLIV